MAPEHQSWMYEADPFAAKKAVQERQEKAAKKKEQASNPERDAKPVTHSPEYSDTPEVKMSSSLRDLVEEAVKKVHALESIFS